MLHAVNLRGGRRIHFFEEAFAEEEHLAARCTDERREQGDELRTVKIEDCQYQRDFMIVKEALIMPFQAHKSLKTELIECFVWRS